MAENKGIAHARPLRLGILGGLLGIGMGLFTVIVISRRWPETPWGERILSSAVLVGGGAVGLVGAIIEPRRRIVGALLMLAAPLPFLYTFYILFGSNFPPPRILILGYLLPAGCLGLGGYVALIRK